MDGVFIYLVVVMLFSCVICEYMNRNFNKFFLFCLRIVKKIKEMSEIFKYTCK